MKYVIPALVATPAFAHGSGHIHPHGWEIVGVLAVLAIGGAAYFRMK